MDKIINELFMAMRDDISYSYSDENISNELNELGHEFLKDGSKW